MGQIQASGKVNNSETKYDEVIRKWAGKYGLHPAFVKAIIKAESSFNPLAYRAEPALQDASYGLMQILYNTARGIGYQGHPEGLYEPELNIQFGAKYLSLQLRRFGSEELAAAAYNAGPGFVSRLVEKHGNSFTAIFDHLPAVTKKYVPRVMGYYAEFKARMEG